MDLHGRDLDSSLPRRLRRLFWPCSDRRNQQCKPPEQEATRKTTNYPCRARAIDSLHVDQECKGMRRHPLGLACGRYFGFSLSDVFEALWCKNSCLVTTLF